MKHLPFVLCCLLAPLWSAAQTESFTLLNIDSTDDYSGFEVLEEDLANHTVFFSGENHRYYNSNISLEEKTFRYLHTHAGVNVFLLEFGAATEWLVDKYFETGDTAYLEQMSYPPFHEYQPLFKRLYEYWVAQPEDKRFDVEGIDREGSQELAVEVLVELMPETRAPDSILIHTDALRLLRGYTREQRIGADGDGPMYGNSYGGGTGTLKQFYRNFRANEALYQEYLGDAFVDFEKVAESLHTDLVIEDYEEVNALQSVSYREEYMYQEFLKLREEYPEGKFFGQFGRCHVSQGIENNYCGFYTLNTLCKRIAHSEDPYLKDKVLSIAVYYPNSSDQTRSNMSEVGFDDLLESAPDDEISIGKVDTAKHLFSDIIDDFSYLIVNRLPVAEAIFGDGDEVEEYFEDSYFIFNNFDFKGSLATFDLGSLNQQLYGSSDGLNPQIPSVGVSYSYHDHPGLFAQSSFTFFLPTTFEDSDTSSSRLSGYMLKQHFGLDVYTKSRVLQIIPAAGPAFGFMHLMTTGDKGTQEFALGDNTANRFFNFSYGLDATLDIRISVASINIGVQGGYFYDLSHPRWRVNGNRLDNGAETKMTHWYAGFTIGYGPWY